MERIQEHGLSVGLLSYRMDGPDLAGGRRLEDGSSPFGDSMSRYVKTTFTCASCGAERKEANHWFVVLRNDALMDLAYGEEIQLASKVSLSFKDAPGTKVTLRGFAVKYIVCALDPDDIGLPDYAMPVCGESCLHKIEAKIIAGQEI
jgi:hypothetical protein